MKSKIKNQRDLLFKIHGENFGYPSCCIEEVVEDVFYNKLDDDAQARKMAARSKLPSKGTGFTPCASCADEIKNMNYEGFVAWLGRDPKAQLNVILSDYQTYKKEFGRNKYFISVKGHQSTLKTTLEDKFLSLVKKYGYDVESYRGRLCQYIKDVDPNLRIATDIDPYYVKNGMLGTIDKPVLKQVS